MTNNLRGKNWVGLVLSVIVVVIMLSVAIGHGQDTAAETGTTRLVPNGRATPFGTPMKRVTISGQKMSEYLSANVLKAIEDEAAAVAAPLSLKETFAGAPKNVQQQAEQLYKDARAHWAEVQHLT